MSKKTLLVVILASLFLSQAFALTLDDVSTSIGDLFTEIFRKFFGQVGPSISCSSCSVGSCSCSVSNCQSGILDVYDQQECVSIPEYVYNFSDGQITWYPESEGTYYLRVFCDDESKSDCVTVNVGGDGATTTTIEGSLSVSSVSCDEDECSFRIVKNLLDEDLIIIFTLVDEDSGRIYYKSEIKIQSGWTGEKEFTISEERDCPSGTELELYMLIYEESDLDYSIYRTRDESFTC